MKKTFPQRFTANAEEFDSIMVEMLEENKDLKGLLAYAKCPMCNGDGAMYGSHGDIEQCQWCYEKNKILGGEKDNGNEKEEHY